MMADRISITHSSGCNKHAFNYIVEDLEAFQKESDCNPTKIDIHPGVKRPATLSQVICESCGQPFIKPEGGSS
jgi:hypothetical protein